jgi:hypothetical protein
MSTELPEKGESLWMLAASPLIWAGHLLASYCTAAIWCEKFAGPGGSLGAARTAIGLYTLLCLVGIALVGFRGWRRHRYGDSTPPHDLDSPADRHRFLGFATLLLSGLSGVAVLYQALSAAFIGSCQ